MRGRPCPRAQPWGYNLYCDCRQAGVGNGSLRAETLQQYRVYPEPAVYGIRLRPFEGGREGLESALSKINGRE